MKRSEAIEKLRAELMRWQEIEMTSHRGLEVYAIAAIDFLEKEIGMLPPSNYPMRVNEWDQE